jgi:uncharacterized protein (DUF1684 family)
MSSPDPQKNKALILVVLLAVLIAVFYFIFISETKEAETAESPAKAKQDYTEKILKSRKQKDIDFTDTTVSRFNAEERSTFHGLNYFDVDPDYRLEVRFILDTSLPSFKMPTNTERTPNYRVYGYLEFNVHDTACRLTAYQNMDYKDDPEEGGYLFVPFSDNTNGKESYGAGRYLDIPIPTEDRIILDFNEAYNPYCAYSDRWSCPLVPFENYLEVSIPAGEKKYKH